MNSIIDDRDTLMSLWRQHRDEMRPIGAIISDAREGKLPGVEPLASGHGFRVVGEEKALAAMRVRQ